MSFDSPAGHKEQAPRLRLLLSYWYFKNVDLDALYEQYLSKLRADLIADSGAFSAMTQGVTIALSDYASWLKRWEHLFSAYFNLDVIKDARKTFENQRALEDIGLTPIPCFHVLEDWKWLERYIKDYRYIGLGVAGMTHRKNAVMRWLVRCFQMAGTSAVYHGFALTSLQVIRSFPWYSVDSSTWSSYRFGRVILFDQQKGRFIRIRFGNKRKAYENAQLLRAVNIEPEEIADRKRNDRIKVCTASSLAYMQIERYLQKKWGRIRIPGQSTGEDGVKVYLALSNSDVRTMLSEWEKLLNEDRVSR